MKLGEFAETRQLLILKQINEELIIEYNDLKNKIEKLRLKILFKTYHLDSSLWDLVELGLIDTSFHPVTDEFFYNITDLGIKYLELENMLENILKEN